MLFCLTANHRNSSFDLLEKLSVGAPGAAEVLVRRNDRVAGAVVLATCNRFEAYLDVTDPDVTLGETLEAISSASGVTVDELRHSVTVLTGDDVPKHLFAVSSGLESVVVGEDEIAGQVRRALERSRNGGTASAGLERLFQRAAQTSRGVKAQTALGGAGRSLVRLALELASSRITDWSETSVLLVGTGQYAATTVAALRDRGVRDIRVFSPSGRAERFAAKQGVRAEPELAAGVATSDVLITCTSSTAPVVAADAFPGGRRQLVIDLGLPRNVDSGVAAVAGVELLDLETISLHAPLEELNATADARAIVGTAAAAFAAERSATPAVVALRRHVFAVLEREIERARRRGDDGTTEAALRHLVGVLLHTPSVRARDLAIEGRGDDFAAGLLAVFGISVEAPAGEADEEPASA